METTKRRILYVVKRDGREESVNLDKITRRIEKLCNGLNQRVINPLKITLEVKDGIYPGVTTAELDSLAAEKAALKTTIHPDFAILAARIAISNLHKEIKKPFSEVIADLYNNKDCKGNHCPLITKKHYEIIEKNSKRLNESINYNRDWKFNYFSFKILEESYLMKIKGKIVELPQQMLMRVSIGIHDNDIDDAIETYNLMSEHYFLHSSTTLLSSTKPNAQMASSFIVSMPKDSLPSIFKCLNQCVCITEKCGSIGINIQNIRAKGSCIRGTGGISSGVTPMLRVFDSAALSINQNYIGKTGAFTIYIEPWHADILDILELKKDNGKDENRAKQLEYALWIPDLFMKRVKNNEIWSLMCPFLCPGLDDCYGEKFNKLYENYENKGNYKEQISARKLWKIICMTQVETGGSPYILYKDSCNKKSNQKNLGTIKGSDFSTEIIQYSSNDEIGCGIKASIALPSFINNNNNNEFNFNKLKYVTKIITKNLNKIIDKNNYPLDEAKKSALKNRPISIGVFGLADTFILLHLPYNSEKAIELNKKIFETIYYGALESSCELAKLYGKYETYDESPISRGLLQFDLWNNINNNKLWDWNILKNNIKLYGIRNSLLTALMPTNNIASIFGNIESIEPLNSNIYIKKIKKNNLEFNCINSYLINDLIKYGIWNDKIREKILLSRGSIQCISDIPDDIKDIYKTVWEISQKTIIDMNIDRSLYIDQSQSINIYLTSPTFSVMSSMHFYAWQKGIKTGLYKLYYKILPPEHQQTFYNNNIMKDNEKNKIIDNNNDDDDDQLNNKQLAKLLSSTIQNSNINNYYS